ncbi:hypothetical protein H4582DRAFT_1929831 [Lactarius indigo]|nr:hypothetical protein H4582DRAFT_1929831 [Lactarius indigo]
MDPASETLDESATLLPHSNGISITAARPNGSRNRVLVRAWLVLVLLIALPLFLFTKHPTSWTGGGLPPDPLKAAEIILSGAPIIDGHIDLPWLVRSAPCFGHVDIPRLRTGRVGGFFWSVYTPCPSDIGEDPGKDFLEPTSSVRDTLEQIDISHQLIHKYSDTFELTLTSRDVISAVRRGKISALIGIEGGHQLGNSLGALRQFAALGVRYVTLTHTCHNVFADSSGLFDGIEPLHPWAQTLVKELNRLGVLVDLSHTSDDTALAALKISRAPVNFHPGFVSADPDRADVKAVADHVDHIASVTGRAHVGIGSDYDGIDRCPIGLEDVSTYPVLVAELYSRGWSADELRGFTGGNFLRVFAGAEDVAREMAHEGVALAQDLYEKRTDIPRKY